MHWKRLNAHSALQIKWILNICFHCLRICLSKNRWNEIRSNCSCLPPCNAIDFHSFTRNSYPKNINYIYIASHVSQTRLKRDIKFGVHYLIGVFYFINFLSVFFFNFPSAAARSFYWCGYGLKDVIISECRSFTQQQ